MNVVNVLKIVLFSFLGASLRVLLLNLKDFLLSGAVEFNEILFVYFQVVHWFKRMQHMLLTWVSRYSSLVLVTECDDTYTFSIDGYKIFVLHDVKATNFWFPKLKAFMLEDGPLFLGGDIKDLNCVSVHVDCLVANKKFFILFLVIPNDCNLSISNIKLVLILQEESTVTRIIFINPY